MADAPPRLEAALLVLHGPHDAVVGIDNASAIFTAARHPKSFVSMDDADYLISREANVEYVADLISGWSSRYLDLVPEPILPDAPEGVARVVEAEASGFRQDIASAPCTNWWRMNLHRWAAPIWDQARISCCPPPLVPAPP